MIKKEKKLFIFCASLQTGGAERVLSVLSSPFANEYDSVEYLMWYDAPVFYELDSRVKLVSVEKECGTSNKLKKILWFRKYVSNNNPSLLISFAAPFNMLALVSLLFKHVPIIVAERNDPDAFRWGIFLKKIRDILYYSAKGILVQTESSRQYFVGSRLENKVETIPNPVLMKLEMVGQALNTEKRPLFVTAARLASQKRHDLLIEVFAEFRKIHPEYVLQIFGKGEEEKHLKNLISTLHQDGHILLEGRVHDLWDRMLPAKAFVMTSTFEGMSNSLIEAMCLGLPCISTKVSGAVDLINNNNNGYLIDIDDRKALLDSMNRIASDEEANYKVAKEASVLFEDLNVRKVSSQWIIYINKMMK